MRVTMRIQTRLGLLIAFCFLFMVGALTAFYTGESRRLAGLFRIEANESQMLFDRARMLESSRQEAFTNDYSIWNELADFLNTGDKRWADTNLGGPIPVFKLNAIWIYKPDENLFYSINNLSNSYFDKLAVPQGVILKLLGGDSKLCHFFMNTPKGVMEIRGATIHRDFDRARKNPPLGYLFTGRLLDSAFAEELSDLTLTKTTINAGVTPQIERQDAAKGLIAFTRELNGWNGLPVAVMHVISISKPIQLVNIVSIKIFATLVLFFTIILTALIFTLIRWVGYPLGSIVRALSKEDPKCLDDIVKRKDELGRTAVMIQNFFEQHNTLMSEIAARKKVEAELKLSEERFFKAFRSNPGFMTISKLESGAIIDVNDAFLRATGFSRDEVIGHSTVDLKIFEPEVRANIRRLLYGKRYLRDMEIEMRTKAGQVKTVLFSAELITIGSEEIMLAVSSDITARKRAEDELQRKMDELERFNKLAVGRELKMLELKAKIEQLELRLKACLADRGKDAGT